MKIPPVPGNQRGDRCSEDAALEDRIAAYTATPPALLRNTILAAVGRALDETAEIEPLPTHSAPEPVWGVLAGVSAVALTLVFAPLLAAPVARTQTSISPAASASLAEVRGGDDIVAERDRLLTAMAYAERPQGSASSRPFRQPTEPPINNAVLRPGDLRSVLEDPL